MLIKKTTILVSVIAAACCSHFGAYAQNSEGFTANATLLTGHDDNILRSVDKSSDSYVSLSPVLSLNSLYGKHNFTALYKGDYTRYSENSNFNSAQHDVKAFALFDHSQKFNSEYTLRYQKEVEEPGLTNSVLDAEATEFEQYDIKSFQAKFSYGTSESIGQVVLALGADNREFESSQQAFRNVDRKSIQGTFYYNLGTKTRLLVESSYQRFDYTAAPINSDQSNDAYKYYLGAEWRASAATTGSFRIGYQEKKYDAEQFASLSGLSYDLDLIWQPNSYTRVSVGTSKTPKESAQINEGGYFSSTYMIGVDHELTPRIQLVGRYQKTNDEVSSAIDRTDKQQDFQIGTNYMIRDWLEVGLHYRIQERNSDVVLYNFNAKILELTFSSRFN